MPAVDPPNFLAPAEAEVLSETGEGLGGLILIVRDGRLSCLEIYTWGDPAPLPPIDRIRPYLVQS